MNLKKLICLLFALNFYVVLIVAQKGSIGVSFSAFSDNDVARFKSLEDNSSFGAGKSYSYGISYLKPLNKWLELETGMEYVYGVVNKSSDVHDIGMGVVSYTSTSNLALLNVPITVRANFLKYFFVNAGLLVDLDVSKNSIIESQTGIGTMFGLGVKYDFKSGMSVFVNPYSKIHVFPVAMNNNPAHFLETAVRIGIMYKF